MTWSGLAAMIAAVAFAILIVFIILAMRKVTGVLDSLNKTVDEINKTLPVVTRDVDNLSIEVEGLLNKANVLVDDLNGKIEKIDPLFDAVGDVGQSISNVNIAANNAISGISTRGKVTKKKGASTYNNVAKVGHTAANQYRNRRIKQNEKETQSKSF